MAFQWEKAAAAAAAAVGSAVAVVDAAVLPRQTAEK